MKNLKLFTLKIASLATLFSTLILSNTVAVDSYLIIYLMIAYVFIKINFYSLVLFSGNVSRRENASVFADYQNLA